MKYARVRLAMTADWYLDEVSDSPFVTYVEADVIDISADDDDEGEKVGQVKGKLVNLDCIPGNVDLFWDVFDADSQDLRSLCELLFNMELMSEYNIAEYDYRIVDDINRPQTVFLINSSTLPENVALVGMRAVLDTLVPGVSVVMWPTKAEEALWKRMGFQMKNAFTEEEQAERVLKDENPRALEALILHPSWAQVPLRWLGKGMEQEQYFKERPDDDDDDEEEECE